MVHLKFDLRTAYDSGATKHPQHEISALGIIYQRSTPQSMGNCWWFWNCENVPEVLPGYLEVLDINPMDAIGFGLSQKEAEMIRDYKTEGDAII